MEMFESEINTAQSIELIGARISRRRAQVSANRRMRRSAVQVLQDNPTKEMDAVMLGDALVGYGNNMSLNNMAIMENVMTMAIMEANYLMPGGKTPMRGTWSLSSACKSSDVSWRMTVIPVTPRVPCKWIWTW